jgi:hypothetical protein
MLAGQFRRVGVETLRAPDSTDHEIRTLFAAIDCNDKAKVYASLKQWGIEQVTGQSAIETIIYRLKHYALRRGVEHLGSELAILGKDREVSPERFYDLFSARLTELYDRCAKKTEDKSLDTSK